MADIPQNASGPDISLLKKRGLEPRGTALLGFINAGLSAREMNAGFSLPMFGGLDRRDEIKRTSHTNRSMQPETRSASDTICVSRWYLSSAPHNAQEWHKAFLKWSRCRAVAKIHPAFPKYLGHRQHSPMKGRLRCQAINLTHPRRVKGKRNSPLRLEENWSSYAWHECRLPVNHIWRLWSTWPSQATKPHEPVRETKNTLLDSRVSISSLVWGFDIHRKQTIPLSYL